MPQNVTTIGEGGVALPRSAEDARVLGAAVEDPAVAEGAARAEARKRMFDTTDYKLTSLAEGIVDAFSAGFIRETGDYADERRANTPGSVFLGQALGTAAAVLTGRGPLAAVGEAGEAVGKAAAREALRAGEKAITTTALREAGAGAAMAGAMSFGHQVLDTVIEDRPFAAEAILDDAKLGGIFGLGGGVLMGGLGKLRPSRSDVAAQGGLIGSADGALEHFESARAAYGEALHFHEQQLGAIKEFRRTGRLGDVTDDFIRVRTDAIREARAAQKALKELDVEGALSGANPASYKEFQRLWDRYGRAMDSVDEIMAPHAAEKAAADLLDFARAPEPPTAVRQPGIAPSPGSVDVVIPASPQPQPKGLAELDALLGVRSGRESGEQAARAIEDLGNLGDPKFFPSTTDHLAANPRNIGGDIAQMFKGARKEAGLPVSKGEQIAAAQDLTPTYVDAQPLPPTELEMVPLGSVAQDTQTAIVKPMPDEVARKLLDDWFATAGGQPRIRPWDEAKSRALGAMETLYQKAAGRLDSAKALGILETDGIAPSTDTVGSYLDSVYALNRAGRLVSDEARGIPTALRKAGTDAVLGAIGMKMLGAGPGKMLVGALLGYGGRLAAKTGQLMRQVGEAVGSFLSSTKIRSVAVAAGNKPWAYSDKGPIEDPVERIQEIQFLASNPDAIRARVREQAGELYAAAPEHIKALEDAAVRQMVNLAVRAPIVYFDRLGRPLSPPQGKLRQFFEYENAVNDLPGLLKSIATGSITQPQVDALQTAWPAVHVKVAQMFLTDPAQMQRFDRAKLRVIEMVTGMPLTAARDPMFLMRQQGVWMQAAQQQMAQQQALSPQAFNINPDGAPTPSQANASGRAPGN